MLTTVKKENLIVNYDGTNLNLSGKEVFSDERHIKFGGINFYCNLEEVDIEIGQFKINVLREKELVGQFFNFLFENTDKNGWILDPKPGDKEALQALAQEMLNDVEICYNNELKIIIENISKNRQFYN